MKIVFGSIQEVI